MRDDFRHLRLRQLARTLSAFDAARQEPRPQHGWVRAIREGLGLSLEDVGKRLGVSRARVKRFEDFEANDRITLQSLRRVAAALDCQLVYAIVPKAGTIVELAEQRTRSKVREDVLDVEHTMGLEDQAPGNVEELIEDETKRRLKK